MSLKLLNTLSIILYIAFLVASENSLGMSLEFYMQGEIDMMTNELESAENNFQKALKLSPESITILLALSEVKLLQNNFLSAQSYLETAFQLEPQNVEVCKKLYPLYLQNGNLEETLKILDIMVINNPDEIEFKYDKSKILFALERWQDLMSIYGEIYQNNPSPEILNNIVEIGNVIERTDLVYTVLSSIWNANPDDIDALEMLVQIAYILDDLDSAIVYLESLRKVEARSEIASIYLSELFLRQENYKQSIDYLSPIYEAGNNSIEVLNILLIAYSEIEDYSNELHISNALIKHHPNELLGYESKALHYLNANQYGLAIETLQIALSLFPEAYAVQFYLGSTYQKMDRFIESERSYLSALTLEPDSKMIKRVLALLYESNKAFSRSDSLFYDLISINENDATNLNDYAYLIAEREQVSIEKLDYALKLAYRAIELEADSPEFLDTVGWILYRQGKYKESLTYLQNCNNLDNKNSIILEHLGDVYSKLENKQKARDIYQKVLLIDPENQKIQKKINILDEQ